MMNSEQLMISNEHPVTDGKQPMTNSEHPVIKSEQQGTSTTNYCDRL